MNTIIKRLTILFAVLAAIGLFTVSSLAAQEKTSGDYTYIVQDDDTVKITAYGGDEKKVTIPSKISGKTVTVIGRYAFNSIDSIESIVIPGTVETIEQQGIYGCPNLSVITVEKGKLTNVLNTSIENCRNLKTVNLPSNVEKIGNFVQCISLENVNINTANTYLKNLNGVIYSADGKTLIKYPQGKKGESFTVPSSVTHIAACAFYEVSTPVTVNIPLTVKTIDELAFAYSKVKISYAGTSVPEKFKGAFAGHKVITKEIQLGAVSKLTATATKTTVTLKWSKVTGADGYRVYKYNSSTKKYEAVKNITGTSLKISKLKSGTTYKFRVRAYKKDSDTIYGAYSSVKEITTQLSAPSKVTSKGGTTSVKLSWSKSRGADGYRIYYKSGDSWKTLVKSVKGTSYTLKDLKKSTKRIYAIRAYKKTSDGTIWSDYKQFSAATKPGKSALTAKSSTGGQAVLTWKKVASANTYRVYYKVNKGDYKLYKTYSKPTKVTIKNLKGGDTCTFKVQAGIKVTGGTVWGDAVTKSVKVAYRTTKVLKAIKSGTYVIGISDPDYNGTIVIARKGDRLYISTDVGDEVTMFYSPTRDVWYYIYDMYGVYSIINDSDLPEDSNANALYAISESVTIPKSFKSTKERIDGMQMFCETAVTDGHKIKYCYSEGGSLEKIITYLDDGSAMSTDVYTFSTTVSDKLFKVPKGYKYIEE